MIAIPYQERQLNQEQKKAVEFGDGPILIIAGAGTGKTTVITERIKYLISSGRAKPQEILALTFTEKASREMEERVDLALPYGVTQMWISTFHSFCDRMLKREGLSIGLDPNFKLMTEAETIQFFRTNLFAFTLSYFRPLGNPNKFISGMIQHFGRLKDEDVSPEQYMDWIKSNKTNYPVIPANAGIQEEKKSGSRVKPGMTKKEPPDAIEIAEDIDKYNELANAYRTYEELKIKHGMMDYGDLIAYALKLFRMRKNILKTYQEQFKYILIDEFQDTNFAQNKLVILLAGKKQNLTTVADDDQAIYRFRGAAISNVIQFRKTFPKAKIVVLTKNYRSTKEILDRSYQLIQNNNPDRLEVVEHIDKKLECIRRVNGVPISFLFTDRVENEAEEVVSRIKYLVSGIKKNDGGQYFWKDIAILVRANAHAEPFIRALSRNGIPYQFLGPGQLFRQPEVKDLICYLKVLYDIHDTVSLFRVLSMDHFQIPPRDIAALISYARGQGMSLFEVCETISNNPTNQTNLTNNKTTVLITSDGEKKIGELMKLINKHLSLLKKETAGQILYYFLEDTGILRSYASIKTTKEERAAENIAKFFDKLKTYESDHDDASVFTVVDWLDLSMGLGESPLASNMDWNTVNAVNILTVHSSKGLEFPVVFLVNLVGARFPTMEKHEQIPIPDELIKEVLPEGDAHLEEERRLFYVGMTRAKDMVYLTASQYYGDGKREKKISPFVVETLGMEEMKRLEDSKTCLVGGRAVRTEEKQLLLLDWVKEKEHEIVHTVNPITYISYSQVETYKRCPLQYKYRYVIRIPAPSSSALSFGDTIHKTLHAWYELVMQKYPADKAMLLKLYEEKWQSVGYKDKKYEEMMKERGIFLLTEFFEKEFDPKRNILALEQSFKIKITPTMTLGGKIDRVDRTPEGKLEIIDYKTGSAPKKRDPGNDMQLSVYALAATERGIYNEKPEDVIVSFYFLEGQEKVSATIGGGKLEQVRKDIKQISEDISKSMYVPTPGKHCDFCEFRLICEAWK